MAQGASDQTATVHAPVVVGLSHDQPRLLSAAVELARTYDAPLRVVHTYWASASSADLYRGRDAQVVTRVLARQVLDDARGRLAGSAAVEATYALKLATVARGLEDESISARILVIGSHEPRWMGHLTTGHVVDHVIRHARCPVVVVPEDPTQDGVDIVVAVDIDNLHREALRFAADLSARRGLALRVVCVLPPDLAGPGLEHQHARLDLEVNAVRTPGAEISTQVVPADAAESVVQTAATAGLVVVGRPNQPHHGPWVGRSVARSLLRSAQCPVVIVPTAGRT